MVDDQVGSALVGPLSDLGLVLDDLAVVPAGRRRVVRVAVDRDLRDLAPDDTSSPVPPLSLDEVAEATRVVGDVLDGTHGGGDGTDLMGAAPYTLEVSSPGTDRPLRGWRGFRRNVGRLVGLTLVTGEQVTARILAVSADTASSAGAVGAGAVVTVEVPATRKQPATTRELPLRDVTVARVQVEFTRPAGAGAAHEPAADDPSYDDLPDDPSDDPSGEDDDLHDDSPDTDDDEETDDGH